MFSHADYSTRGDSTPTRFLVVFDTCKRADKVIGSMKVRTRQLLLKSIPTSPFNRLSQTGFTSYFIPQDESFEGTTGHFPCVSCWATLTKSDTSLFVWNDRKWRLTVPWHRDHA